MWMSITSDWWAMTGKEALTAAEISQSELSRRSGINLRQIQKIVAGDYKAGNVTAKNLSCIADILGVDPRELIKRRKQNDNQRSNKKLD